MIPKCKFIIYLFIKEISKTQQNGTNGRNAFLQINLYDRPNEVQVTVVVYSESLNVF